MSALTPVILKPESNPAQPSFTNSLHQQTTPPGLPIIKIARLKTHSNIL